jgi:Holliday junction resolvasome RuvABC DNA-binding subunit
LLIELKSRLDHVPGGATSLPAPADGRDPVSSALADVREGLAGLGYGPDEIAEATRGLEGGDAGALLKQALKALAGGR